MPNTETDPLEDIRDIDLSDDLKQLIKSLAYADRNYRQAEQDRLDLENRIRKADRTKREASAIRDALAISLGLPGHHRKELVIYAALDLGGWDDPRDDPPFGYDEVLRDVAAALLRYQEARPWLLTGP